MFSRGFRRAKRSIYSRRQIIKRPPVYLANYAFVSVLKLSRAVRFVFKYTRVFLWPNSVCALFARYFFNKPTIFSLSSSEKETGGRGERSEEKFDSECTAGGTSTGDNVI